jgi:hypothetical protein
VASSVLARFMASFVQQYCLNLQAVCSQHLVAVL